MADDSLFHDVLILGGGAGGLGIALELPPGTSIGVLSKGQLDQGATNWAQGGIAAVLDPADSVDAHVEDTMIAGAGLNQLNAVRFVVEQAPGIIRWLEELGIDITREASGPRQGQAHLNREGGHSFRRVVHAADATGKAVQACLERAARTRGGTNIYPDHVAIDLVMRADPKTGRRRCVGVYALDCASGRVRLFRARAVVLATGGASRAYQHTSNPPGATGDGIAMAWRAGCRVANMEFTQFHPTCLTTPAGETFLISETVRGEGAKLILPDGQRFMDRFDARGELAPRDVVARAIDHEMKRLGIPHVLLDVTHKGKAFILEHFPTLYARCLELGFDMTREALPVVPAAHYTCGGIMTDMQGRTDVDGLYAVGECASTGLHGANRLASNSLLECLVFGREAGHDIGARLAEFSEVDGIPPWDESWVRDSDEEVVLTHNWDELRRFMWDYVGIVRTTKRLERALHRSELLSSEIHEYYANFSVSRLMLELRNMVCIAQLIVRSALARRESRGLHYTLDHPAPSESGAHDTVLVPAHGRRMDPSVRLAGNREA
ncbi:MAG: L-aspartate oxidase [Alphaproteobacteria bacterium]